MKRWVEFNLNHPKLIITILAVITVISCFGLKNLYFDGSTDVLMPKNEKVYKLGQRAKKVFGDSKTFLIAAVEPKNNKQLFSFEVFSYLNTVVNEIEEFKDFNYTIENQRINALMKLAKISIQKPDTQTVKTKSSQITKKTKSSIEDNLDQEIFDDAGDTAKKKAPIIIDKKNTAANDMWDLSSKDLEDFYVKATRKRNIYNYKSYSAVSINDIESVLDKDGTRQLKTILHYLKLDTKNNSPLTVSDFQKIMETWETLYLYKSKEIVKSFINPITGEDIIGTKEELKSVDLVATDDSGNRLLPKTDEDFSAYKDLLLKNPTNKSTLYSEDKNGKIQALAFNIILRPQRDHFEIYKYLFALFEKYQDGPVSFSLSGIPVYQTKTMQYMMHDLQKLLPLVVLMVIFIFYLNFRMLRGVVLPAISVIMGMIWTMGTVGFTGIPVTVIVNMLPTLLIAVASSDSIHIFNQYLHDQKTIQKKGKKAGLLISMNHISLTVLLTSLTTFIGFITLSTNQVTSLRDFGIFSAIGTVIAMAVTIFLIPSALMLLKLLPLKDKKIIKKKENVIVNKIITFFNYLSLKKYKSVSLVSLILIIVFIFGISKIKVETAPLYNFKESSDLYQLDLKMSKLFGGTIALNLVIDSGKKDGVKDPEFLHFIDEVRTWLTSEEGKNKYHHLNTYAFSDVIKRMHKAMNGDNHSYYKIPDNQGTIEDYIQIFSGDDRDSDGRIDSFEQFVDRDFREANIILRTGNYKDKVYSSHIGGLGIDRIKNYMENHPKGKNYKWHLVGEPYNFVVLAHLIIVGQIKTIIITLFIIALIMLFLFKNWQASLVSLTPITISIIFVYGLMGYLKIPLDLPKSLLAALAIGIGVDDTIHMFKTLSYYISKGDSIQDAITHTHKEAGTAIIYTSLALILGFGVFMFSEFRPVFYLGWLVALTMTATTISALVLLPSIINLFKIDLKENLNWKILKKLDLSKIFHLKE